MAEPLRTDIALVTAPSVHWATPRLVLAPLPGIRCVWPLQIAALTHKTQRNIVIIKKNQSFKKRSKQGEWPDSSFLFHDGDLEVC